MNTIGIDIGATNVRVALLDENFNSLKKKQLNQSLDLLK